MNEIDIPSEFFAPSTSSPVEYLIDDYNKEVETAKKIVNFINGEDMIKSISHFADGWNKLENHRLYHSLSGMFELRYAIASLNAKYWTKALNLTDVMDYMPSKARDEWHEQIRTLQAPDFDSETVKATLADLLNKRMDFLAEMVDGIFTGLSGEHVTNRPEGFGKRMIIDSVCCGWSSYGSKKQGLIQDLRSVISKFMGNEPSKHWSAGTIIDKMMYDTGTWHSVDGNAFRMRVYKKGTAHIEVNQDISYRLNQILAYLHPMAIPAPHKKRPNKKQLKDFELIKNTIPNQVIDVIDKGKYKYGTLSMEFGYKSLDKHLKRSVKDVIEAIGGSMKADGVFEFGYEASSIIRKLTISGLIPDSVSHQYYPTPEPVSLAASDVLGVIGTGDKLLEPSAGQGSLLEFVGLCDNVTCIEADSLHCEILRSKGYENTIQADFLKWTNSEKFDKIIMNPPYSQGRWQAHLDHAVSMLADGGKLVAVLPTSCQGKLSFSGKEVKYHGTYSNEFKGTSIAVIIVEVANERQ